MAQINPYVLVMWPLLCQCAEYRAFLNWHFFFFVKKKKKGGRWPSEQSICYTSMRILA